ncbi:DUF5625 family protein [Ralstonia pseudosolanacearum]
MGYWKKGSRIEQAFKIDEYRGYDFDIGFGSKNYPKDAKDQEWRRDRRVWDFIGDGGTSPANNKGVIVPVHIQVERIGDEGGRALITDQIVNTQSMVAGGNVITRLIINIKLKPGKYRVVATTLQESELPESIGTYLHIGFYPKATVIKDEE